MYRRFFKRLIDIVVAVTAILILSPFLLIIAFILWVTGEHYVFYGQKRVGYELKTFKIWKFVTMVKNSPSMGTGSITLRNDPRVLPFGKFLRKTKINELPQLFNILIGDMSIIGPRPLMKVDFEKFSLDIQKEIYNVRPGLTGIASIVFADEEKFHSEAKINPHDFDRIYISPYKGKLESWYQEHLTFFTDIKVIYLTIWAIVRSENGLIYKVFKDLPEKPNVLW